MWHILVGADRTGTPNSAHGRSTYLDWPIKSTYYLGHVAQLVDSEGGRGAVTINFFY
jgi:hypothetical protein